MSHYDWSAERAITEYVKACADRDAWKERALLMEENLRAVVKRFWSEYHYAGQMQSAAEALARIPQDTEQMRDRSPE